MYGTQAHTVMYVYELCIYININMYLNLDSSQDPKHAIVVFPSRTYVTVVVSILPL